VPPNPPKLKARRIVTAQLPTSSSLSVVADKVPPSIFDNNQLERSKRNHSPLPSMEAKGVCNGNPGCVPLSEVDATEGTVRILEDFNLSRGSSEEEVAKEEREEPEPEDDEDEVVTTTHTTTKKKQSARKIKKTNRPPSKGVVHVHTKKSGLGEPLSEIEQELKVAPRREGGSPLGRPSAIPFLGRDDDEDEDDEYKNNDNDEEDDEDEDGGEKKQRDEEEEAILKTIEKNSKERRTPNADTLPEQQHIKEDNKEGPLLIKDLPRFSSLTQIRRCRSFSQPSVREPVAVKVLSYYYFYLFLSFYGSLLSKNRRYWFLWQGGPLGLTRERKRMPR